MGGAPKPIKKIIKPIKKVVKKVVKPIDKIIVEPLEKPVKKVVKEVKKAPKTIIKVVDKAIVEPLERPVKKIIKEVKETVTGTDKNDYKKPAAPVTTPEVTPEIVEDEKPTITTRYATRGKRSGQAGTIMEGYGVIQRKKSGRSVT